MRFVRSKPMLRVFPAVFGSPGPHCVDHRTPFGSRCGSRQYDQQSSQKVAYNNGYQEGLRYGQSDRSAKRRPPPHPVACTAAQSGDITPRMATRRRIASSSGTAIKKVTSAAITAGSGFRGVHDSRGPKRPAIVIDFTGCRKVQLPHRADFALLRLFCEYVTVPDLNCCSSICSDHFVMLRALFGVVCPRS